MIEQVFLDQHAIQTEQDAEGSPGSMAVCQSIGLGRDGLSEVIQFAIEYVHSQGVLKEFIQEHGDDIVLEGSDDDPDAQVIDAMISLFVRGIILGMGYEQQREPN